MVDPVQGVVHMKMYIAGIDAAAVPFEPVTRRSSHDLFSWMARTLIGLRSEGRIGDTFEYFTVNVSFAMPKGSEGIVFGREGLCIEYLRSYPAGQRSLLSEQQNLQNLKDWGLDSLEDLNRRREASAARNPVSAVKLVLNPCVPALLGRLDEGTRVVLAKRFLEDCVWREYTNAVLATTKKGNFPAYNETFGHEGLVSLRKVRRWRPKRGLPIPRKHLAVVRDHFIREGVSNPCFDLKPYIKMGLVALTE